jgi:predicted nucleotidyltransferase
MYGGRCRYEWHETSDCDRRGRHHPLLPKVADRGAQLFGSVLRPEEFREDSDVDVIVTFETGARWTLFDFVDMQDELTQIFGRKADLLSMRALKNPLRRRSILSTARVLYAA